MICRGKFLTGVSKHLGVFWVPQTHLHPIVNQMSSRVDALENSIQDIINGDVSVPQSPSPSTPGGMRRSDSGMQ